MQRRKKNSTQNATRHFDNLSEVNHFGGERTLFGKENVTLVTSPEEANTLGIGLSLSSRVSKVSNL